MKLLVIGASGRTGRLVVQTALDRGHIVSSLVRSAGSIRRHPNQRVIVGDPIHIDDLVPEVGAQDTVVSCLGQRSDADAHLLCNGAAAALELTARLDISRYLVISQGLLFPTKNPLILGLRWILARHVADSRAMERLVCASPIDWTIVRPPRLTGGCIARGYTSQADGRPAGAGSMHRADLATFLVDEAEQGRFKRAIVGISSP